MDLPWFTHKKWRISIDFHRFLLTFTRPGRLEGDAFCILPTLLCNSLYLDAIMGGVNDVMAWWKSLRRIYGSLNVPIEHHPTISYIWSIMATFSGDVQDSQNGTVTNPWWFMRKYENLWKSMKIYASEKLMTGYENGLLGEMESMELLSRQSKELCKKAMVFWSCQFSNSVKDDMLKMTRCYVFSVMLEKAVKIWLWVKTKIVKTKIFLAFPT